MAFIGIFTEPKNETYTRNILDKDFNSQHDQMHHWTLFLPLQKVLHQQLQNGELCMGQGDGFCTAADCAAVNIEHQIGDGDPTGLDGCRFTGGPAQNGLDAHQKLRVGKGLDNIVVGAGGEAHDLVRLAGIGGEKDNGRVKLLPDSGSGQNSVELGHVDIQKIKVNVHAGPVHRRLAVSYGDDLIALAAQQQLHNGADLRLVIGHKNALGIAVHGVLLSQERCCNNNRLVCAIIVR